MITVSCVECARKIGRPVRSEEDRTEDAVWAVAKLVTEHHGGDYTLTNPHGVTMRLHVERDEEND